MSTSRPRVLCVDDKRSVLDLVSKVLGDAYEVTLATDGEQALTLLSGCYFDAVVTDVRMPGAGGFAVLARARETDPDLPVILLTAFGSVPMAVEAIQGGAYDYLTKPFEPDELRRRVRNATEVHRLRRRARHLQTEPSENSGPAGLVGRSPAMRRVYDLVEKAKDHMVTILLTGESGTGKEVVARAIHARSIRADGPFVPVHCGALPETLIESELFGHTRGAFTGATSARRGLAAEADGGTLFLDEIQQLPVDVQGKLNRLLQESVVRRVGDGLEKRVDVRFVAATNSDLGDAVQAGTFREDLFYRLRVFPINLPPLRERGQDVALLAEHLLQEAATRAGRTLRGFSAEAMRLVLRYPWPGNVRELSNMVERAVILEESDEVTTASLPNELLLDRKASVEGSFVEQDDDELISVPYKTFIERERKSSVHRYLLALMRSFDGNVSHAAERASLERESLHRLLRRSGISAGDYRSDADESQEKELDDSSI